jgi:hypothetical protein
MQQQNPGQNGVINQQPPSNQNLSAKEIEQIKEMQKWEQIRKQRREENGIPEPGMKRSSNFRCGCTDWL